MKSMNEADDLTEQRIAERLRALGATLRMTKKGRIHTVDFRAAGAAISDAEAAALQQLDRLHELYLAGTAISDAAIARLGSLERLETLDLENTAVTDAALPRLARLPQLKLLVLRGTPITRDAVAALRKQMIGARIVT
jgi:hypothetical protein